VAKSKTGWEVSFDLADSNSWIDMLICNQALTNTSLASSYNCPPYVIAEASNLNAEKLLGEVF